MSIRYVIARSKKLKTAQEITATVKHDTRDDCRASNVDKGRSDSNIVLVDTLQFADTSSDISPSEKLLAYYEENNVKVRKNSVLAHEHVVSASPEFFSDMSKQQIKEWAAHQVDYFKKTFGDDNVKFVVLHLDESTPHLHIITTPVETKVAKYKYKGESREKLQTTLNARKYDRKFFREHQTNIAKHNAKYNLSRGVAGSKATHKELKEFAVAVKAAQEANYEQVVEKFLAKRFNKQDGIFGAAKYTFEEIKNALIDVLSKIMSDNKKLKTSLKHHQRHKADEQLQRYKEEVKEARKLKNTYETNKGLQKEREEELKRRLEQEEKLNKEYRENNKKLIEENNKLSQENVNLKRALKPTAQNVNRRRFDR